MIILRRTRALTVLVISLFAALLAGATAAAAHVTVNFSGATQGG